MEITQTAHGLAVGDWVRLDSSGDYVLAQADSEANAEVVGVVIDVADTDTFTLQDHGFADVFSGLTAGDVYYLDESVAGAITDTEPSGVGEVSKPVLTAASATEGWITSLRGFVVSTGGGGGAEADPIQELHGTPDTAFEFESSSLTGLTALGSPAIEDADTTYPGCYFVQEVDAGVQIHGRYFAAPSAPWTVIMKVKAASIAVVGNRVMLFHATNSGGTPIHFFSAMILSTATGGIVDARCQYWPNQTTIDSNLGVALAEFSPNQSVYLAIKCNSATDIDFLVSRDGRIWTNMEVARNPTVAQDYIGFGINVSHGSSPMAAAIDFVRVWESALALQGEVA